MAFKDNSKEVKSKLDKLIANSLNEIGIVGTSESQLRTPVDTGKLRRAQTHRTNEKEKHVDVGVTKEVDYGIYVHEGTSRQRSQPFLRDALTQNTNKFKMILEKHLKDLR